MSLKGHNDTVTGMAVSPDGTHLLTNAMDNTLRVRFAAQQLGSSSCAQDSMPRQAGQDTTVQLTCHCGAQVWDMRPYAPANRCTKVFTGHQHNFEKNLLRCAWSADGSQVRPSIWATQVPCVRMCSCCWMDKSLLSAKKHHHDAGDRGQRRPDGLHLGRKHASIAVQAARSYRFCERGSVSSVRAYHRVSRQRQTDISGGAGELTCSCVHATQFAALVFLRFVYPGQRTNVTVTTELPSCARHQA